MNVDSRQHVPGVAAAGAATPDSDLDPPASRRPSSPVARFLRWISPRHSVAARVGWLVLLVVLATNTLTATIILLHHFAYQPPWLIEFNIAAAVILGFMYSIGLALIVQRSLRQLAEVARQARQLRKGTRETVSVPEGSDEVAQIAQALATTVEKLNADRHTLESRVRERTAEVEQYEARQRKLAVTMERLRIARDMHDSVSNTLLAVLQQLRVLRALEAMPDARARMPALLLTAEQTAERALAEVRGTISQIRDHEVATRGLLPALGDLLHRFSGRTGIEVQLEHEPEVMPLSAEPAETVFRIVEEALRNVERHARASRVQLHVRCGLLDDVPAIELVVADDGVGFDASQVRDGRYGLVGLREQAEVIGAQLQVDSRPGAGTRLVLTVATRRARAGQAQSMAEG